ncbi:uncharacterized protein BYT42DRAFT_560718 [Radiomyces spectabilis]|uniref:uncharacterized protein n=1 Tax=Radiomyces spectabilis TaxID=64574 RepID=UPI002220D08A|nr:uncharacterized protein BYT42DRAFT_560718 [Radiomyces spectabilis]KAI8388626.1 hypothetical protein BYT42DRAFT_560718 [Radiomyces spectabilis]
MPNSHRKKPFSGKQKKLQLQAKNARKAQKARRSNEWEDDHDAQPPPALSQHFVPAVNENFVATSVPLQQSPDKSNRLVSMFEKLSPQQINEARLRSMKPFHRLPQNALEISIDSIGPVIDFPKRPKWDYEMSKEEVETQEETEFQSWMKGVYERYGNQKDTPLSWFEHNLEVWRQLWRVLEISDIILVIMDIRQPLLHFPQALYHYVTKTLGRPIVGVFNKVDLVSEFTVFSWRKYFEEHFPELQIACFSCYPRDPKLIDDTTTYALKNRVKRPRKRYFHAEGVRNILSVCQRIERPKEGLHVDWTSLINRYNDDDEDDDEYANKDTESDDNDDDSDTGSTLGLDDEFSQILDIHSREVQPHNKYLTLGLVGHPNVGKSSLINSIMRKTVVSASRTPGHTKHFQTIYLSDNVRLCDSPGLVFPSVLPRALQILSGMYPVAQVQEPYSVVQYLAERIPLEKILSLSPPDLEEAKDYQWSAWAICEAFAEQRGFHTARAARPDVYRAANVILRLANDGRILLSFKPEGFFTSTKYEQLRVKEADAYEEENATGTEDESSGTEDNEYEIQTGGAFALLSEE